MGDISNVLGGPWSPPPPRYPDPLDQQLSQAIKAAGLAPPADLKFDGKIHRFSSDGKKGGNSGWYVAWDDSPPSGRFGCWKDGTSIKWSGDTGQAFTEAERMAQARRWAEAGKARDAALKVQHKAVSEAATTIWASAMPASPDHPYLARKKVQPHGTRVTSDGRLIVPMYEADELKYLQFINHDGVKRYSDGGEAGGMAWALGEPTATIYIAEGFATAASIHEATGAQCWIAFSASNLPKVSSQLREANGDQKDIVIVADADVAGGAGLRFANLAADASGVRVVSCPLFDSLEKADVNDYAAAGYDLKDLLEPPVSDWLVAADDFSSQPKPIKWMVKRWLQDEAFIMVHGPSGGGKTFVVLDWCMSIAGGLPEWNGCRVKAGAVVYLAGEGHNGLRARLAAWKQAHSVHRLNMWLSKAGCDLNTPNGYRLAADAIRALGELPRLIVVDTLHRFLDGDENSSQDAKSMIDACGGLMREFGCAVLLVHHTGVSESAQERARGSSAWKGALDIELSVVPVGDQIRLTQKKMKDGEQADPIYMQLESIPLNGWVDEDGDPVTSAVPRVCDAVQPKKKDGKLEAFKKLYQAAWWASGAEEASEAPYISRSAMLRFLTTNHGMSEASARQYVKPSAPDKLIGALLVSEILTPEGHGWRVTDPVFCSSLMIAKNGLG